MTKRTLDIGVDLDGCVYRFLDALRDHCTQNHGIDHESMPEVDTYRFYDQLWGWTTEEFLTRYADGVHARTIMWSGGTYPDAVETLQRLYQDGHRLHVVTAREIPGVDHDTAHAATHHWLTETGVPFETLLVNDDKTVVEVDCFIEDFHDNYVTLEQHGSNPYLLTKPWNVQFEVVNRVDDWSAFAAAVDHLAK